VENLFGGTDPLDQIIRIKKVPFTVLGVLSAKGQSVSGQDQDDIVLLSVIGGLVGIALGLATSVGLSYLAKWATLISGWAILLAFAVSGLVGVFFGSYPARKAALLNPIEALRYE
jgi:putative ABC transport system permease protein